MAGTHTAKEVDRFHLLLSDPSAAQALATSCTAALGREEHIKLQSSISYWDSILGIKLYGLPVSEEKAEH